MTWAFLSRRERRLWTWTAAFVVGIYSTIGIARTLAGLLRDQGLLAAAFALGMTLVGATVVAMALRTKPSRAEIGVGLGIAAVYLMTMLRMTLMEERSHLIEYSVVASFMYAALLEREANGARVRAPALLAIAGTSLVGFVDECIQYVVPGRVFDLEDVVFNTLAAFMAVMASVALLRLRGRSTTSARFLDGHSPPGSPERG